MIKIQFFSHDSHISGAHRSLWLVAAILDSWDKRHYQHHRKRFEDGSGPKEPRLKLLAGFETKADCSQGSYIWPDAGTVNTPLPDRT